MITIGQYVAQLVQDSRYCGSMLPRIPVLHLRALESAIQTAPARSGSSSASSSSSSSSGGGGGAFGARNGDSGGGGDGAPAQLAVGTIVEGLYAEDGQWYPGKIKSVAASGKYWVLYDEPYGNSELLA
jgi:hypothetical protein